LSSVIVSEEQPPRLQMLTVCHAMCRQRRLARTF
jgi:hypothetical protein